MDTSKSPKHSLVDVMAKPHDTDVIAKPHDTDVTTKPESDPPHGPRLSEHEAKLSEDGMCAKYGADGAKLNWDVVVEPATQPGAPSFTAADAKRVRENFHAAAARANHSSSIDDEGVLFSREAWAPPAETPLSNQGAFAEFGEGGDELSWDVYVEPGTRQTPSGFSDADADVARRNFRAAAALSRKK